MDTRPAANGLPKDKLQALSRDERALLLFLGYVANQILMFQKLLTFATQLDAPTRLFRWAICSKNQSSEGGDKGAAMIGRLDLAKALEAV